MPKIDEQKVCGPHVAAARNLGYSRGFLTVQGVIFIYDAEDPESFRDVESWLSVIEVMAARQLRNPQHPHFILLSRRARRLA